MNKMSELPLAGSKSVNNAIFQCKFNDSRKRLQRGILLANRKVEVIGLFFGELKQLSSK